jgi:ribonuclease D
MSDIRKQETFIELISTAAELQNTIEELKTCSEISIDTEYDSFQRQYGFKLLLIQIWNGKKIYLIDPIKVHDLTPLWRILEEESICKVLYAGSEDIALLKQSGCATKNIYDRT